MIYTKIDAAQVVYEFFGGKLDGKQFNREGIESIAEGYTADNSRRRAMGALCARAELDNQPTVAGYYGPMYDGIRHIMKDGSYKYDLR